MRHNGQLTIIPQRIGLVMREPCLACDKLHIAKHSGAIERTGPFICEWDMVLYSDKFRNRTSSLSSATPGHLLVLEVQHREHRSTL